MYNYMKFKSIGGLMLLKNKGKVKISTDTICNKTYLPKKVLLKALPFCGINSYIKIKKKTFWKSNHEGARLLVTKVN